MHNSQNFRRGLLLILLLFVASIRRTLLKSTNKTNNKEHASIKIQKVAKFNWNQKKICLIPNKAFRYYNLHSSIFRICIKLIFHSILHESYSTIQYNILKRTLLSILLEFQRHLASKNLCLKYSIYKTSKYYYEISTYTNASKKIDDSRL